MFQYERKFRVLQELSPVDATLALGGEKVTGSKSSDSMEGECETCSQETVIKWATSEVFSLGMFRMSLTTCVHLKNENATSVNP